MLVPTGLLALLAVPAYASAAAAGESNIARFLLILGAVLIVGKLSGELFERIGQPAVLGN